MTEEAMTHAQADERLPLLLAGTLPDAELRALREHVSTCLACRREQKHLAVVNAGLRRGPAGLDVPTPDPARVLDRIDAYEERRRNNWLVRLVQVGREPPVLVLGMQAAVVLLAVFVLLMPARQEPQFTTLSQPQALPAGQYVRAVFAPTLDEPAITALVESMQFRVVDGPTERGVYTLRWNGPVDPDVQAAALRSRDDVLFAEAIVVEGVQ